MPNNTLEGHVTKASSDFSPSQNAGGTTGSCSYKKVPTKPCNLKLLRFTEPKADCDGKTQQRTVEIKQGQQLRRGASPTLLPVGGTFQITANSRKNGTPRTVKLVAQTEAVCNSSLHPLLGSGDSEQPYLKAEKTHTLNFYRQDEYGDSLKGFFAVVNSIVGQVRDPISFPQQVDSCGLPSAPCGESIASLNGIIEVYPGDQFSAELKLPPLLKPDKLSFEIATENWISQHDGDKETVKEAGKRAEEIYRDNREVLSPVSSKAEFRQFAEDMEKKKIGYLEDDPESIEVSLTQKDGHITNKISTEDVVKLCQFIRSAEYRVKEFNRWIDNFTVGPGAKFSVDCQFLVLKFKADWGYTEYLDDRVYMKINGSIDVDIIKLSLKASLGFRAAGGADLILSLEGEGSLGVSAEGSIGNPDEKPNAKLRPRGSLEISGKVDGALLWTAKANGTLTTTFKAETEKLEFLTKEAILAGEIVVSRDPVVASVTYSCRGYGSRIHSMKLVKEDPEVAKFSF